MAIYMWREYTPTNFTATFNWNSNTSYGSNWNLWTARITFTVAKDMTLSEVSWSSARTINWLTVYKTGTWNIIDTSISWTSYTFNTPIQLEQWEAYYVEIKDTTVSSTSTYRNILQDVTLSWISDISEYMSSYSMLCYTTIISNITLTLAW